MNDELTSTQSKIPKVKVKSVYNISDDRAADIDVLKYNTKTTKIYCGWCGQ